MKKKIAIGAAIVAGGAALVGVAIGTKKLLTKPKTGEIPQAPASPEVTRRIPLPREDGVKLNQTQQALADPAVLYKR